MLEQGEQSRVSIVNERLLKEINCHDAYGNPVGPYEECKILKYVSHLGPEFPQNVYCEGSFRLSYDYIPGITPKKHIDQRFLLLIPDQKTIALQILQSYHKLWEVGIEHNDFNPKNFLIDPNGQVHILDFGGVSNPYRDIISPPPQYSFCSSESEEEEAG